MNAARALILLLRPHQWLKNLMLYFPPFLGGVLNEPGMAGKGVIPFIAFSAISSSGYILNDLLDREKDRLHSKKRTRPLPSGAIGAGTAIAMAMLLFAAGAGMAAAIQTGRFLLLVGAYALLTTAYSLRLKDIPVVDLFCVSTGFIIRLLAGGEVFHVRISDWLFLSVFLLSIFLSVGKRITEKNSLGTTAGDHRRSLSGYPDGFLEGVMYMTGGAVLVTYSMYCVSRGGLLHTVPLCCFGLMRYIMRVQSGKSGDPTESLLKDPWLILVSLFWSLLIGWKLYGQ